MFLHTMKPFFLAIFLMPACCSYLVAAPAIPEIIPPVNSEIQRHALKDVLAAVPRILADQSTTSGQWGKGIWIVQDQHPMWTLAVVWATRDASNPYYHSSKLLKAIEIGGNALIKDADKNGEWMFRKKDGSTWDKIYMPWTYSRWIRSYQVVKDAMSSKTQKAWDSALKLGYSHIAMQELGFVQNIPTYHAAGLYCAGEVFHNEKWKSEAANFLHRVADKQDPAGYWTEHSGPVVGYNAVYVEALGIYYSMSKDPYVLPALTRSAKFHSGFTYPDGTAVHIIDERQVYSHSITSPCPGFFVTPQGKGYAERQTAAIWAAGKTLPPEVAANILAYWTPGPVKAAPGLTADHRYETPDSKAVVDTHGNWCVALSAYTAQTTPSRWIQDRQNLAALFHKAKGLILGGGNTKLTPLWSTFTVGDTSLLFHVKGDSDPSFANPPGLQHVPSAGALDGNSDGLKLQYGNVKVSFSGSLRDAQHAALTYSLDSIATGPVEAHLPLLPRMGKHWKSAGGRSGILSDKPFTLKGKNLGAWFELDGIRFGLPHKAFVKWPVMGHNQYAKYGESTPREYGRVVIGLPLGTAPTSATVTVHVPAAAHGVKVPPPAIE